MRGNNINYVLFSLVWKTSLEKLVSDRHTFLFLSLKNSNVASSARDLKVEKYYSEVYYMKKSLLDRRSTIPRTYHERDDSLHDMEKMKKNCQHL